VGAGRGVTAFPGKEPSDPTGALGRKKGKEAPRRQSGTARLEDIVTRRLKAVIPKPPDVLLTLDLSDFAAIGAGRGLVARRHR
jgi:hypothetical protein